MYYHYKKRKINEKETGKTSKNSLKKIVSSKKIINEKERAKGELKEPKGKRKSQRAETVIEKNHTKTNSVLHLQYQHKKAP